MTNDQCKGVLRVAECRQITSQSNLTPTDLRTLPDPTKLSLPLQALWHDAQGNWERAHEVCQQAKSRDGDWVHAYLHRKEGDAGNAAYWYSRAGHAMPDGHVTLDGEWTEIARALLGMKKPQHP
jgi:hypothetical protein